LVTFSGIQDAQGVSLFPENEKDLINQERDHIMEVIIHSPGSQLEEVVFECPDLTWHQVFCELDRLSRAGQVQLTTNGPGLYAVSSPAASNSSFITERRVESCNHRP
jgi:hypothetical protein